MVQLLRIHQCDVHRLDLQVARRHQRDVAQLHIAHQAGAFDVHGDGRKEERRDADQKRTNRQGESLTPRPQD